jgi:hypothetical protein
MMIAETYSDTLDPYYKIKELANVTLRHDHNPGTSHDDIVFDRPAGRTGTTSWLKGLEKLKHAVDLCESQNKEPVDSNAELNNNKYFSVIFSLWKHIDKLKQYGVEWIDEDIEIGPTDDVLEKTRSLIPKLVFNDLIPFRVTPSIDEGVCLAFLKDSLLIYVEFYNDGDIGLIAEDYIDKKIIENIYNRK